MKTADILSELPRLDPAELAQVRAKLCELVGPDVHARPLQMLSPRLVNPEQSTDFAKQVVELAPDAHL